MVTSPNEIEMHQDFYLPSIQQTVMTTCLWQLFEPKAWRIFNRFLGPHYENPYWYPPEKLQTTIDDLSLRCIQYVHKYAVWIQYIYTRFDANVMYRLYKCKYTFIHYLHVNVYINYFFIHVSCIYHIYKFLILLGTEGFLGKFPISHPSDPPWINGVVGSNSTNGKQDSRTQLQGGMSNSTWLIFIGLLPP